jgi:hypothetical protein
MNLREHIDTCIRAGFPRIPCIVVNFALGVETLEKMARYYGSDLENSIKVDSADLREVDLTLLTNEELQILDKEWTDNSGKFGRVLIDEEKQRRAIAQVSHPFFHTDNKR